MKVLIYVMVMSQAVVLTIFQENEKTLKNHVKKKNSSKLIFFSGNIYLHISSSISVLDYQHMG